MATDPVVSRRPPLRPVALAALAIFAFGVVRGIISTLFSGATSAIYGNSGFQTEFLVPGLIGEVSTWAVSSAGVGLSLWLIAPVRRDHLLLDVALRAALAALAAGVLLWLVSLPTILGRVRGTLLTTGLEDLVGGPPSAAGELAAAALGIVPQALAIYPLALIAAYALRQWMRRGRQSTEVADAAS